VSRVVVDTGVLFAAADRRDRDHRVCVELLNAHSTEALVLPVPVAVEAAWLIEHRLGPEVESAFVASLVAGDFTLSDLVAEDWSRVAELLGRYVDLRLGVVDASVIALAERLSIDTIATLNHRDFAVVRPHRVDAFTILP
jgi:predicted nucleic acid-binding protein